MRQDLTGQSWKTFWNKVKDWLTKKKEEAETNKDITVTKGFTGSAALGGGASVSVGHTKDTKGNTGIAVTVNGGGGFPNLGVGRFISVNNAPTIYEQEGLGTAVGASGGPWAVAVGAEYNTLINQEAGQVYHGGTLSATFGFYPTVVEVHGEVGYTFVWGFNIYDVAISVVDWALGN